jgi:hypothetical protein
MRLRIYKWLASVGLPRQIEHLRKWRFKTSLPENVSLQSTHMYGRSLVSALVRARTGWGQFRHNSRRSIAKRDGPLVAAYNEHLVSCQLGQQNLFHPPTQQKKIVTQLLERRQAKQSKLPWLRGDMKAREQVQKLVKFAIGRDDMVKMALSAQPYAALAWSTVSVLLVRSSPVLQFMAHLERSYSQVPWYKPRQC